MRDLLHVGGIPLLLAVFLGVAGVLALVASVGASLIFKRGWALPLGASVLLGLLAFLTVGTGIAVYSSRSERAERAAAMMDPSYRQMIEAEGSYEAGVPLFALLVAATPAGAGAIGLMMLASHRRSMPIPID